MRKAVRMERSRECRYRPGDLDRMQRAVCAATIYRRVVVRADPLSGVVRTRRTASDHGSTLCRRTGTGGGASASVSGHPIPPRNRLGFCLYADYSGIFSADLRKSRRETSTSQTVLRHTPLALRLLRFSDREWRGASRSWKLNWIDMPVPQQPHFALGRVVVLPVCYWRRCNDDHF